MAVIFNTFCARMVIWLQTARANSLIVTPGNRLDAHLLQTQFSTLKVDVRVDGETTRFEESSMSSSGAAHGSTPSVPPSREVPSLRVTTTMDLFKFVSDACGADPEGLTDTTVL